MKDILKNCKEVPMWARYLTVDYCGKVWVWEGKPIKTLKPFGNNTSFERGKDSRWAEWIGDCDPKMLGLYKVKTTVSIELENITSPD